MPRGKVPADMITTHLLEGRPAMDDDATTDDPVAAHRPVVVRRLLARGLSPDALDQILPGWSQLADE